MSKKTNREIQLALIKAGFSVGPDGPDGVLGVNTRAALRRFQAANGIKASGLADDVTLLRLFPSTAANPEPVTVTPPWFADLMRIRGLHEQLNNAALQAYLKSDGQTLGDPAKHPWCGDAVQTPIALTLPDEPVPTNPYWAQNWKKFGVSLGAPALGAVLVFVREGGGHVGFYVGENATHYFVLGGNQSNSVSVAPVAKSQCIAIRWPKSYQLPKTGRVQLESTAAALTSAQMA